MISKLPRERVFVGNIMQCIDVDSTIIYTKTTVITEVIRTIQLFKENAILFKTMGGHYIELDSIKTWLGRQGRFEFLRAFGYQITDLPINKGDLFVNERQLKSYDEVKNQARGLDLQKNKKLML